VASDEALAPYLGPDARDGLVPRKGRALGPAGAAAALAAVKELASAGATILAGTDAPNQGVVYGASIHDELAMLVTAGLTPVRALEAATSAPARVFGLGDRGRVAPGLRADLLLVDGDPTRDILATRRIAAVWHAGVRVDREAARAKVAADFAALAASAQTAGLISDFSEGTPAVRFGTPWQPSTDRLIGGTSTATLAVEDGALRIRGEVVESQAPRLWAGALFFPGSTSQARVDLSKTRGLAFSVRGEGASKGKAFVAILFTRTGGRGGARQPFTAGADLTRVQIPWSAFGGSDGHDVTGILIAAISLGSFELVVDDVELY